MNRSFSLFLLFLFIGLTSFELINKKEKPTLWIIGDSTVKNGSGKGEDGLWGWGDFAYQYFDTTKISIKNCARGGRSSRTYQTEGLWDEVLKNIKPRDFVMIQFGHNDGGNINDNHRARGTIKGNGDETEEIDNILTGKHEIVHSFGWYIRKYIDDARAKGATPIVLSLVARNIWEEENVVRATDTYTVWSKEAAQNKDASFIDLNDLSATAYEKLGQEYVTNDLFLEDHTHTNRKGAILNARLVAKGVMETPDCSLKKYLNKPVKTELE